MLAQPDFGVSGEVLFMIKLCAARIIQALGVESGVDSQRQRAYVVNNESFSTPSSAAVSQITSRQLRANPQSCGINMKQYILNTRKSSLRELLRPSS